MIYLVLYIEDHMKEFTESGTVLLHPKSVFRFSEDSPITKLDWSRSGHPQRHLTNTSW